MDARSYVWFTLIMYVTAEKDDQPMSAFHRIGSTTTSLGYSNMKLSLNFTAQFMLWDLIEQVVDADFNKREDKHPAKVHDVKLKRQTIADNRQKLRAMMDLDKTLGQPKEKRAVGAVFGVMGTFMGLMNRYAIKSLERKVTLQDETIDAIVLVVDELKTNVGTNSEHVNKLQHLAKETGLHMVHLENRFIAQRDVSALMDMAIQETTDMGRAVDKVLQHRLSRDIIKQGELGGIVTELKTMSEAKGFSLVIENEADVFQCEASYATTQHGIDIFVHIPIAREGDIMQLYRHIPLPIKVAEKTFIQIQPKHDVLAISDDGMTFRNMDRVDLADCHHVSDVFLCDGENTKEKVRVDDKDSDLCLYNVFRRKFEDIRDRCPSTIGGPISAVQTIGHNYFVFFSKRQHEGTMKCHGKKDTRFTAKYVTTKKVEPGCIAETETHIAAANLQVEGTSVTHAISWPYDAKNLLGEMDALEFEEARLEAEEALEDVPTDVKGAKKWLAARNKWQMRHLKEWSGLSAMVAIIIVIGVMATIYITYRCRNSVAKAAARALLPKSAANAVVMELNELEKGRSGLTYNMVR
jgi:uncharacterized coiled-coil protein SlyX